MFGPEIRDKDGVAATVLELLSTLSLTWYVIIPIGFICGTSDLTLPTREDGQVIPWRTISTVNTCFYVSTQGLILFFPFKVWLLSSKLWLHCFSSLRLNQWIQTSNSYFICNDPPTVDKIFARIRNYDVNAFHAYSAKVLTSHLGLHIWRDILPAMLPTRNSRPHYHGRHRPYHGIRHQKSPII